MQSKLLNWIQTLRSSFWLLPSVMALFAVSLSYGGLALDSGPIGKSMANSLGWLWSGGAEGARSLLSTVASSMITVAGTVFSITIAALTLASSQFGPKLLRNFTQDTGNQVVLGIFIATYLYCLLVLRTLRGQSAGNFVPYLSVTGGLLLAMASLGVLIYFIHHVASAIQAERLIAKVGVELKAAILRLYPEQREETAAVVWPGELPAAVSVRAGGKGGYVQAIDRDGLLELADEHDLLIEILRRPGDFAFADEALLHVWAKDSPLSASQTHKLCKTFSVGRVRTSTQDIRYGANQLTEIASRALSPGINDPFTAMACIDWLMDALATLAARQDLPPVRVGAGGAPRLLERQIGFGDIVQITLGPLGGYAKGDVTVTAYVLGALARLVRHTDEPLLRTLLAREASQVAQAAQLSLDAPTARSQIGAALAGVADALEDR